MGNILNSNNRIIKITVLLITVILNSQSILAYDDEESWNLKVQSTYIREIKPAFDAPYTGSNSLKENYENSWTFSSTAFFGARVWDGGEIYINPEAFSGVSLSDLHGLGGFNNGEDQKGTNPKEQYYIARFFLRQTFNFGGEKTKIDSDQNQLGGWTNTRKLVLTIGKISLTDIFDNNIYSHDARKQFMNWSLMTYGAYDYAADTKGYTEGIAVELYYDDWAIRYGRFMEPSKSNGPNLDGALLQHYGDQIELQHSHIIGTQNGTIRVLLFQNKTKTGSYDDAINYGIENSLAPDLSQVRKEQYKKGGGINIEQSLAKDIGMFARASWNDGKTETFAFTEIDRSYSIGLQLNGRLWQRNNDSFGIGTVNNALSSTHKAYLSMGGMGAFLGDGQLNYKNEQILEAYYSYGFLKHFWCTLDMQRIQNPGYNADRGKATFLGIRLHTEF